MNLNDRVRRAIIDSVMASYDRNRKFKAKDNEDLFGGAKASEVRQAKARYKRDLQLAPMTFKTLEELRQRWPKIFKYVQMAVIDPVNSIHLP